MAVQRDEPVAPWPDLNDDVVRAPDKGVDRRQLVRVDEKLGGL